jgi:hypothetical protein
MAEAFRDFPYFLQFLTQDSDMSRNMGQARLHSACVFADVPVGKKVDIWPNIKIFVRNMRKKPSGETKM